MLWLRITLVLSSFVLSCGSLTASVMVLLRSSCFVSDGKISSVIVLLESSDCISFIVSDADGALVTAVLVTTSGLVFDLFKESCVLKSK